MKRTNQQLKKEKEKEDLIPIEEFLQVAATAVRELKEASDWHSKEYTYGYLLEHVLKLTEKVTFDVLEFMNVEYSDYGGE